MCFKCACDLDATFKIDFQSPYKTQLYKATWKNKVNMWTSNSSWIRLYNYSFDRQMNKCKCKHTNSRNTFPTSIHIKHASLMAHASDVFSVIIIFLSTLLSLMALYTYSRFLAFGYSTLIVSSHFDVLMWLMTFELVVNYYKEWIKNI